MPKSHHSKYSDTFTDSISGVSGNFGGRDPFDRNLRREYVTEWQTRHYPPLERPDDYVPRYAVGDYYYEGTTEARDHRKYDKIAGQAAKRAARYTAELNAPLRERGIKEQFHHHTYRRLIGDGDVDYDKRARDFALLSRDAHERCGRNRDKFEQKHPDVYWSCESKEGHRKSAVDAYRASLAAGLTAHNHEKYMWGRSLQDRKLVNNSIMTAARNIAAIRAALGYRR